MVTRRGGGIRAGVAEVAAVVVVALMDGEAFTEHLRAMDEPLMCGSKREKESARFARSGK